MIKKAILLLLVVGILCTSLSSCGSKSSTSSASTELSSENTKNSSGATITENSSNTTTEATPLPGSQGNIASYAGIWSVEDLSWEYGGFMLEISIENGILTAYYCLTGSAPASRIAEITGYAALSSITDSTITMSFENDNWGNSGKLTMVFKNDTIQCTLSDVKYSIDGEYALWGLYDCEVELVRNNDARKDLFYTMDDYYKLYPEEKPTEQPVYDTSKASGILAQAGLTEQEFKNRCTYIGSIYNKNNTYVYAAGQQYYAEHPEENKHLTSRTKDWNNYKLYGTKPDYYVDEIKESSSLEDFLNRTIYGPKGASILGKQSEEIFKKMQEYPTDYIGQPFLLKDFRTTYVFNNTYTDDAFVLYGADISVRDYRDNVNNPNILQGLHYDMYVLFLGTDSSNDLVFALISVDRCE